MYPSYRLLFCCAVAQPLTKATIRGALQPEPVLALPLAQQQARCLAE
jgi:hypothetical protein